MGHHFCFQFCFLELKVGTSYFDEKTRGELSVWQIGDETAIRLAFGHGDGVAAVTLAHDYFGSAHRLALCVEQSTNQAYRSSSLGRWQ
jgi:hypothetical protein